MTTAEVQEDHMTEDRKYFFHTLFTTAMEGGINYWSACTAYHWEKKTPGRRYACDIDDFFAIIESTEGDWGMEAAYQPNMSGMLHPVSTVEEHMVMIKQDQALRIDLQVMERGWNLFMDKVIAAAKTEDPSQEFSNTYFRQAVVQYLTDGEEGDSDADVADLVVQLGLFGEHVYS